MSGESSQQETGFVYDAARLRIENGWNKPHNIYGKDDMQGFVCGWGAAVINTVVTFPVNKLMFRQQLHGMRLHKAFKQMQSEGLRHLYRGLLPPFLQKTFSLSLMFGLYDVYGKLLTHTFPNTQKPIVQAIAGMGAGFSEAILTPFERLQTLLQDHRYHSHFNNTFDAFKTVRTYGFSEYYRGVSVILLRNGFSNAVFFNFRGVIKDALPTTEGQMGNFFEDFVSGAVLGALLSTLFFPMNVTKTAMQARLGGEFINPAKMFLIVYETRGRNWKKMFRGVHLSYSRAMISWGIINASYELLRTLLFPQSKKV
ncbi:solute carrier family 25 member 51-like [Branchiostoma floridae]|uniref:Solute carrier family 25 member 51-like n=1 Tax=Branchiostoma floridae TaxID=7739 RepID=C3ZSN2_BRAFL|nr:solute carrier family 25 member 51-like [Branchiostoma floridae]XP_035659823.1 solute carrier family 25 member 51-like [Branchiostoma floridae]XP_035659824.1 solute carrier family 25 member 51-like [Branchiostoma floridae]|eukprot:XP_002588423.1 hypothetical protein BRAFLDRAFT_113471 [Branchiostoma floridae]